MINRFDFKALSYMSSFFSILSLFIVYLFTKRLCNKRIAIFTLLLFTTSPISLAIARRALQDSTVCFFLILTVYLFYLALHRNNIFLNLCFAASFFASLMIKETSILLLLFFIFILLFEKTFFDRRLKIIPISFALFISLAGAFISYIMITGGIENFIKLVNIILLSPATNEYAIKYQSGNLLRYLYDFFLVSPVTVIASMGFFILYFFTDKFDKEPYRYLVFFFIILYIGFSFFSKNIRYVMVLDVPIRIFTAVFISSLLDRLGEKGALISLAVIAGVATVDFFIFQALFLRHGIYDPVTHGLISAWKGLIY